MKGAAREFAAGIGMLGHGFGLWRRRPGLALLGLVPAAIVAAVLGTVIVLYLANAAAISAFLTPFADGWTEVGRGLLRVLVAAALLIGILVSSVLGFTALTLTVGDPFYERIWRAVERDLGDVPLVDPPFWRTVADSALLVVRAALLGLISVLIGLIPVVGGPIAAVLGVGVGGWNLAVELTARPLEGRGIDRRGRLLLLRRRRARVAGFGIATQLLFLLPGGAVLGMPAAVAGATALARSVLPEPAAGRMAE